MFTRRQLMTSLAAFPALLHAAPRAAPRVQTRYGVLEGERGEGLDVFRAIPYGAPTGGAKRFMPPLPPAPWPGVRPASRHAGFERARPGRPAGPALVISAAAGAARRRGGSPRH